MKKLLLVTLLATSSVAYASSLPITGFKTPTELGYQWSRGDINSLYAEWDNFTKDGKPDVDSKETYDSVFNYSSPVVITSTKNLYSTAASDVATYEINVDAINLEAGNKTVLLQLKTLGNNIDANSFEIIDYDKDNIAYSPNSVKKFAGTNGSNLWLLTWNVGNIAEYEGTFAIIGKSEAHTSVTNAAVDVAVNEVPLPAAAWLFGSALAGLMIKRKR